MLPVCRENGVEIVGRSLSESKKPCQTKSLTWLLLFFSLLGVNGLFFVFQCIEDKRLQLVGQFRVILDTLFGGIASLTQLGVVVAVP